MATTRIASGALEAEQKDSSTDLANQLRANTSVQIEENQMNWAFAKLIRDVGIADEDNPLNEFGREHDIHGVLKRVGEAVGITVRKTTVPAFIPREQEKLLPLYALPTQYINTMYETKRDIKKGPIFNPRHLIVHVIRDMILKAKRNAQNGDALVKKLEGFMRLCSTLSEKSAWGNTETIEKLLFDNKDHKVKFLNIINNILDLLATEVNTLKEENKRTIFKTSTDKMLHECEFIINSINSIVLSTQFGEYRIPLGLISPFEKAKDESEQSVNMRVLNNIFSPEELMQLRQDPKKFKAYKEEQYKAFKAENGIDKEFRKMVETPDQLYLTKILYNNSAKKAIAKIESLAISAQQKRLEQGVESLSQGGVLLPVANEAKETRLIEARTESRVSPIDMEGRRVQELKKKAKEEYISIQVTLDDAIRDFRLVLPKTLQNLLNSNEPKDTTAKKVFQEFIEVNQRLLIIRENLFVLHQAISNVSKMASILGELGKYLAMRRLDELYQETRDTLKKLGYELEVYKKHSDQVIRYAADYLNQTRLTNMQIASSQARSAKMAIEQEFNPALVNFYNSLDIEVMCENLLEGHGAVTGLNECMELATGRVNADSPFLDMFSRLAMYTIKARNDNRDRLKQSGFGDHTRQLMGSTNSPAGQPKLVEGNVQSNTNASAQQALCASPEIKDVSEIRLNEITDLKLVNRDNLTIGEILKDGVIGQNVNKKFFLNFGGDDDADFFPLSKEAAHWLQNRSQKWNAEQISALEKLSYRNINNLELRDVTERELVIQALRERASHVERLAQIKLELKQNDKSGDFSVRMSAFKPSVWWFTVAGFVIHGVLALGATLYLAAKKSTYAKAKQKMDALLAEKVTLNDAVEELDSKIDTLTQGIKDRELEKANQLKSMPAASAGSPVLESKLKVAPYIEEIEDSSSLVPAESEAPQEEESKSDNEVESKSDSEYESRENTVSQHPIASSTRVLTNQLEASLSKPLTSRSSLSQVPAPAIDNPKSDGLVSVDPWNLLMEDNLEKMAILLLKSQVLWTMDEKLKPKLELFNEPGFIEAKLPGVLEQSLAMSPVPAEIKRQVYTLAVAKVNLMMDDLVKKILEDDKKNNSKLVKVSKLIGEYDDKARSGKTISSTDRTNLAKNKAELTSLFKSKYQQLLVQWKYYSHPGLGHYVRDCVFEKVCANARLVVLPPSKSTVFLSEARSFFGKNKKSKVSESNAQAQGHSEPGSRSASPPAPATP